MVNAAAAVCSALLPLPLSASRPRPLRVTPAFVDASLFSARKRKRRLHPHDLLSGMPSDEEATGDTSHKESSGQELLRTERNSTMEPLMVFPLRHHSGGDGDDSTASSFLSENSIEEIETQESLEKLALHSPSVGVDKPLQSSPSNIYGDLDLAPSFEIAYFYLQNKLGLSDETMWKITMEAGSALGMTSKNLEWKVSVLRRNMNLSDDDIREIITKQPTILQMSADKNIAPTILFLVRALDLGKADLRTMVLRYPSILCYSMDNLRAKVNFYTEVAGFSIEEMRKLVVGEPYLMCASVRTGLMPRFEFLHKEMAIPLETLRSIIMKNPRVLLYSVEKNLKEKLISFFVFRLRMEPVHIQKLLSSWPKILDYNLHDHLLPIAQYFMDELEYSPTELRSIIVKYPRLMSPSLLKIKHVVGYFRYEIDLDAPQVKRVIFQAPQTVTLADNNLRGKVHFLRETFGLNDDELKTVVVGMPTLMLCGIESNLQPKAEYLLEAFDNDNRALKDAIITQPTLMGYSLEKRIKPRMAMIMQSLGGPPKLIRIGISMTEANFESWLTNKEEKIAMSGGSGLHQLERKGQTEKRKIVANERPTHAENNSVVVKSETRREEDPGRQKEEQDRTEAERRKARIVHWKR